MTTSSLSDRGVAPSDRVVLRAAASAYLGRYRGASRLHTESDLRIFFNWCTDHRLDPLKSVRADIERYVRWLQDVRRYQPGRLLPRFGAFDLLEAGTKSSPAVLKTYPFPRNGVAVVLPDCACKGLLINCSPVVRAAGSACGPA
jgi:hypothetical protein